MEAQYNAFLDRCDRMRDEMGEISEKVSLGNALESLWDDFERANSNAGASTSAPGPEFEHIMLKFKSVGAMIIISRLFLELCLASNCQGLPATL